MNSHANTSVGKTILAYIEKSISQQQLIRAFESFNNREFGSYLEEKTLLHFVIGLDSDIENRCFVIDKLLERAQRPDAQQSGLFQFLMTRGNNAYRSPFYETFNHPGFQEIAAKISAWTLFGVSLGFIAPAQYVATHFIKNNQENFPLAAYATGGYFEAFGMVLAELKYAVEQGWMSQAVFTNILTQPNRSKVGIVDIVLASSCHKTIERLIYYAGNAAFGIDSLGYSAMDRVALAGQSESLKTIFRVIAEQLVAGRISSDIYQAIFLKRTRRDTPSQILHIGLLPNNNKIGPVILEHAEWANQQGWLTDPAYRTFLLNHPQEGYNQAHEVVRCGDDEFVYAYINACLRAILRNKMTLGSFMDMLLKSHRNNYTVLHQAISKGYIETAELFINLFRLLLPKKEYATLLTAETSKGIPLLRCDAALHSNVALKINDLLRAEKTSLIRDADVFGEKHYILASPPDKHKVNFLESLDLIRLVKTSFIQTQQRTESMEVNGSRVNEISLATTLHAAGSNVPRVGRLFSPVIERPKKTIESEYSSTNSLS